MKATIIVQDDAGQEYEGEVTLVKVKKKNKRQSTLKAWYRSGSTIEKLVKLINQGFFDKHRSITDIIEKLKSQDYHLKASGLTLPLRRVVRKGLLEKAKDLPSGRAKKWMYIKK
jgi:hypothetical protein